MQREVFEQTWDEGRTVLMLLRSNKRGTKWYNINATIATLFLGL